VRTRLLACLAGGLLGVAVAFPVEQSLALSPIVALIGCPLLGAALGYVVSMFFDVFTASEEEDEYAQSWAKNGRDGGART
jgi:hypothetical protein